MHQLMTQEFAAAHIAWLLAEGSRTRRVREAKRRRRLDRGIAHRSAVPPFVSARPTQRAEHPTDELDQVPASVGPTLAGAGTEHGWR
jgi:hypothetical protein